MIIYWKTRGFNRFYKSKVWLYKSNKGYWMADFTDTEEISKYMYYKQLKDARFIINPFNLVNNSLHEIGNKKFLEKLLDNQSEI